MMAAEKPACSNGSREPSPWCCWDVTRASSRAKRSAMSCNTGCSAAFGSAAGVGGVCGTGVASMLIASSCRRSKRLVPMLLPPASLGGSSADVACSDRTRDCGMVTMVALWLGSRSEMFLCGVSSFTRVGGKSDVAPPACMNCSEIASAKLTVVVRLRCGKICAGSLVARISTWPSRVCVATI
jgi:hypothetical protein